MAEDFGAEIQRSIAYHRDKGITVTVYVGQRRGQSSTADFGDASIRAAVEKAVAIARFTAEDPCAGLADPARLARAWPDLDLYHRWALTVDAAIALSREAERAALAVDPRLVNSEGATVSRGESEFVYANSKGFMGGWRGSRHHIDCSVIGEDRGAMQRDYWYTASRVPGELMPAAEVGRIAGERTARRLNARKLGTVIDAEKAPHANYKRILQQLEHSQVLYLSILLNDVGKATNAERHAEASCELARHMAKRLKLSEDDTAQMLFLVRDHLKLSMLSQRRDLDDQATIDAAVRVVKTESKLDMLMLLTFADGYGTSPASWTDWKEALLWEFYTRTRQALGGADRARNILARSSNCTRT